MRSVTVRTFFRLSCRLDPLSVIRSMFSRTERSVGVAAQHRALGAVL
jgi:hypothetical protein